MKKQYKNWAIITTFGVGIAVTAMYHGIVSSHARVAEQTYLASLEEHVVMVTKKADAAPDIAELAKQTIELELLKGARLGAEDMTIVVPMEIGLEIDILAATFNELLEAGIIGGYSWVEEHPVWSKYMNALPIRVHGIDTSRLLKTLSVDQDL